MAYLFGILYEDAEIRLIPEDEFYYIKDKFITFMNKYQGYDIFLEQIGILNISRLRLAHGIWRMMPMNRYKELGEDLLYELINCE